jgi:hypothetical protein
MKFIGSGKSWVYKVLSAVLLCRILRVAGDLVGLLESSPIMVWIVWFYRELVSCSK